MSINGHNESDYAKAEYSEKLQWRFVYVCYKLGWQNCIAHHMAKEYHRHFNASKLAALADESVNLWNDGGNNEIFNYGMWLEKL